MSFSDALNDKNRGIPWCHFASMYHVVRLLNRKQFVFSISGVVATRAFVASLFAAEKIPIQFPLLLHLSPAPVSFHPSGTEAPPRAVREAHLLL